jgi:hypothetical protein
VNSSRFLSMCDRRVSRTRGQARRGEMRGGMKEGKKRGKNGTRREDWIRNG